MTDKQNSEKIILGIDPGTNLMVYGVLRVTGERLTLLAMTAEELRIGGRIEAVAWVEVGR